MKTQAIKEIMTAYEGESSRALLLRIEGFLNTMSDEYIASIHKDLFPAQYAAAAMHTPGPWIIEQNSSFNQIGDRLIIRAQETSKNLWDQICEVGIIHTGLMGGTPAANARLIAAAPELLAELEKAHVIIRELLNAVPDKAKSGIAATLYQGGIATDGMTRAHEREEVINRAKKG